MRKVLIGFSILFVLTTLIIIVKRNFSNTKNKIKVSELKFSENGVNQLKKDEAFRSKMYLDSTGNPTIGYGTLIDRPDEQYLKTAEISESEATDLLRRDVKPLESAIRLYVKPPLTQNQFDALVIFGYNVGIGNLIKSSVVKRINEHASEEEIIEAFNLYVYSTDKKTGKKIKLQGLANRRKKETDLFLA